jgi:hypothetical protein
VKTDSRPLYQRRHSVELRIAALESALFQARECHTNILREIERADTIPAPPMPANDVEPDVEFDWAAAGGGE